MKTTFLKLVLPAFAILMAVGLAFATEGQNVTQPGYYNHPINGSTPVPGGVDCLTTGQIVCKYGIYDVFADEGLETPLFKTQ